MFINHLLQICRENQDKPALVWRSGTFTYRWLRTRTAEIYDALRENVDRGAVTALEADFSPNSIALMLALIQHGCILVPLPRASAVKNAELLDIAEPEVIFRLGYLDEILFERRSHTATHPLYRQLRCSAHPGLVLFSSGSTGNSKAALHDVANILEKFRVRRRSLRTIGFLRFDHIGGLNTLLYTLSNAGCLITVGDRSPDSILAAVDEYKAELLPASPTFLNLVLLSEAFRRHNTQSLKIISYGTEPMPEYTLRRSRAAFPNADFHQTYGLSEVGILSSKSRSSDSVWVRVGGEGFETRVVDGILQVKARSAMLGYLNAPSPFTEDGWFITGDAVEIDGEYFRILGRKSDVISVGGDKVYPTEVENIISQLPNIAEVTVFADKHPITGNVVAARVRLLSNEDIKSVRSRVKDYCRERLQSFKVPVRIEIDTGPQYGDRFKKIRPLATELTVRRAPIAKTD